MSQNVSPMGFFTLGNKIRKIFRCCNFVELRITNDLRLINLQNSSEMFSVDGINFVFGVGVLRPRATVIYED